MHLKYKLLGTFLVLTGSLGVLMLGVFWFPSFLPKAAPSRNPIGVSLKLNTVTVDQAIRNQFAVQQTKTFAKTGTNDIKVRALIFMERPSGIAKVTGRSNTRNQERKNFFTNLKQKTTLIQNAVLTKTASLIRDRHMIVKKRFFIDNVILVDINEIALNTLIKTPGILSIVADSQIQMPPLIQSTTTAPPEWNLTKIAADRVWSELGVTGQGVVVANIDTGVQWDHPALKTKYRGWDGTSVSHDYNWYDPSNTSPTIPLDNNGHGTHTMGTIVGSDATNTIGVAPDAKWIAVKGCASSSCLNSDLLTAGQWLLAPTKLDGSNPDPSRAPDIINNSWGGDGCSTWFGGVVDSWNAAGIFSTFSAGNTGPNASTVGSPGDNSQSFSVGATDVSDVIGNFSSRGPSCVAFGTKIKPEISAPGVSIRSSIPENGYTSLNGTSMAAPHIAGVAALMLQANPNMTPSQIAAILTASSTDFGLAGVDNTYGSGLVNAYTAVISVPSPTPFPTTTPSTPLKKIQIIQPNGAEQLSPGSQYPIRWNSEGVSQVMIDIIDGNGAFSTIALPMTATIGEFLWTIPQTWYGTSHAFRIKVYEYPSKVAFDMSDAFFSITYITPTPTRAPTPTPTSTPRPTATQTLTPTPTQTPTAFGNAIQLLNSQSSIYGTSVDISILRNTFKWNDFWTIEGWFKPENLANPNPQVLFFAPISDTGTSYRGNKIYISNSQLYATYHTPTNEGTLNGGPITAGWHNIAFTSNNDVCSLFLDGVLKAQTERGVCKIGFDVNQYITAPMTIGAEMQKYLSGGSYVDRRFYVFTGQIDEFYIYFGLPVKISTFQIPTYPFPEKTGNYQYRFDTLVNSNQFASFGYDGTYASMYGNNFKLMTSTIPYVLPSPTPHPVPCDVADLTKDGKVDATDRSLLLSNFWSTTPLTSKGELNGDGTIDMLDYSILVSHYNQSTGACL